MVDVVALRRGLQDDRAAELEAQVARLLAPFSGDERHGRRIRMLSDYESSGVLPPLPESASGSVSGGS